MGMNILQCSSIEKLKTADCTSPWVQNLLLGIAAEATEIAETRTISEINA